MFKKKTEDAPAAAPAEEALPAEPHERPSVRVLQARLEDLTARLEQNITRQRALNEDAERLEAEGFEASVQAEMGDGDPAEAAAIKERLAEVRRQAAELEGPIKEQTRALEILGPRVKQELATAKEKCQAEIIAYLVPYQQKAEASFRKLQDDMTELEQACQRVSGKYLSSPPCPQGLHRLYDTRLLPPANGRPHGGLLESWKTLTRGILGIKTGD